MQTYDFRIPIENTPNQSEDFDVANFNKGLVKLL
jgi:hypothetical protein